MNLTKPSLTGVCAKAGIWKGWRLKWFPLKCKFVLSTNSKNAHPKRPKSDFETYTMCAMSVKTWSIWWKVKYGLGLLHDVFLERAKRGLCIWYKPWVMYTVKLKNFAGPYMKTSWGFQSRANVTHTKIHRCNAERKECFFIEAQSQFYFNFISMYGSLRLKIMVDFVVWCKLVLCTNQVSKF